VAVSIEFPPFSVAGRDAQLRRALAEVHSDDLSVVVLTSPVSIRWLTGFTGSSGVVVLPMDPTQPMTLFTDGRYEHQAATQIQLGGATCRVVIETSAQGIWRATAYEVAVRRADAEQRRVVGFEPRRLSVADHEALNDMLVVEGAPPGSITWVSVEAALIDLRRHKSPDEIRRITRAASIADAALRDICHLIVPGISERELRDHLEVAMRVHGSDGPSFDTIVAFGLNAALPHHRPDGTVLGQAETVVIDFGATVDGYHSDMTRSFVSAGPEDLRAPLLDRHRAVREACEAGVALVGPGVQAAEIDAACRRVLAAAGLDAELNHGIGHGVGLEIHESPWVNPRSNDILRPGDVVTVEPGAYRVGLGGIRVEELVLVTDTGRSVLTHSTKDPSCPPSPPTT
jgi:Xaa-Pro aminopeptidase